MFAESDATCQRFIRFTARVKNKAWKTIYTQKLRILLTPKTVNAKRSPHIKKTRMRLLLAVNLSVREKIKNARQSWAAQCRELNFGKDNPGTDEA